MNRRRAVFPPGLRPLVQHRNNKGYLLIACLCKYLLAAPTPSTTGGRKPAAVLDADEFQAAKEEGSG